MEGSLDIEPSAVRRTGVLMAAAGGVDSKRRQAHHA
jgi:hypothetical protein